MAAVLRRVLPIALITCMLPAGSRAVQVQVPLVDKAPTIDGQVSAEERSNAESVELTKIGGLDRPRHGTQVFVSTTLDGLYVGFIAAEPALDSVITSTTQDNGAVFDDDSLQVLITPTLDTAADSYYHFAVNPDGVKYSSHLITGETVRNYQSAVYKSESAWHAEFFIPMASIDAPSELPHWRANFARNRPGRQQQSAEVSAWVNPGISLHNYKKFGYLTMPRLVARAPEGNSEFTTSPVDVVGTSTATRTVIPAAEAEAP